MRDRFFSDPLNLLAATDISALFLDRELRVTRYTPKLADIFNVRDTDRGRLISDLTHGLGSRRLQQDALAVLERLAPVEQDFEDDQGHWYMTRILPYRSTDDRIEGVVITFTEITARKRGEEARLLALSSELNHRLKNALAAVQSIANHTLRKASDPALFAKTFQDRLHAFSRTHSLLARHHWSSASLAEVLDELVKMDDGKDIVFTGPNAQLATQTVLTLSLILHELATNARTHGALSSASGRLTVTWSVLEPAPELQLTWRESGGPPVKPPAERGFGMMLIERSLSGVGGSARVQFDPGGLVCLLQIPLLSATWDKEG